MAAASTFLTRRNLRKKKKEEEELRRDSFKKVAKQNFCGPQLHIIHTLAHNTHCKRNISRFLFGGQKTSFNVTCLLVLVKVIPHGKSEPLLMSHDSM